MLPESTSFFSVRLAVVGHFFCAIYINTFKCFPVKLCHKNEVNFKCTFPLYEHFIMVNFQSFCAIFYGNAKNFEPIEVVGWISTGRAVQTSKVSLLRPFFVIVFIPCALVTMKKYVLHWCVWKMVNIRSEMSFSTLQYTKHLMMFNLPTDCEFFFHTVVIFVSLFQFFT